ncbi:MAG: ABC transporter permease [Methanomethylovorans sp.]|uniref:ABC transporter permease n=1 Tax=Methanomethylovorans sp. TaxID=2758717 RepID=UPI003C743B98
MASTALILHATWEHIVLVYSTLLASILIAIPLAIASLYNRQLASVVIYFANLVQAVPSFAVIAIVVPFLGIGFIPALIAIMLRALLPIIKNTYIGLTNVDPALIDYANGIGLSEWQIQRYIRFPNAYPAMFAGIRFSAILANSIAVLTAFIGSGGLGGIIFQGLIGYNAEKLLLGAIPAIFLAMLIDYSFALLEKKLTPACMKERPGK